MFDLTANIYESGPMPPMKIFRQVATAVQCLEKIGRLLAATDNPRVVQISKYLYVSFLYGFK